MSASPQWLRLTLLSCFALMQLAHASSTPVFFDDFRPFWSASCGSAVDYPTSAQWRVNINGTAESLQRVLQYPCSGSAEYQGITNKPDVAGSAIYQGTLVPGDEHEVRARLQLTDVDFHTDFHLYLNASQNARIAGVGVNHGTGYVVGYSVGQGLGNVRPIQVSVRRLNGWSSPILLQSGTVALQLDSSLAVNISAVRTYVNGQW